MIGIIVEFGLLFVLLTRANGKFCIRTISFFVGYKITR